MPAQALPTYRAVDTEIRRLRLAITPAEMHGSLSGYLCAGGTHGRATWLGSILADEDGVDAVREGSALDAMYSASSLQLDSPDFEFELLLPSDDEAVAERGEALVEWCRGFLSGFGLAASATSSMSEDATEALSDIGRIAASDISYEDPEADEQALEEVAEFIRVAALLLHSDCVLGPRHRRKLN